jgi:hypothetical protein
MKTDDVMDFAFHLEDVSEIYRRDGHFFLACNLYEASVTIEILLKKVQKLEEKIRKMKRVKDNG